VAKQILDFSEIVKIREIEGKSNVRCAIRKQDVGLVKNIY
jgi:hypothetical protein